MHTVTYFILVKGLNAAKSTALFGKVLERAERFVWLEPPEPNGRMTVWQAQHGEN